MKKTFFVLCLCTCVLLSGCSGVSREEYDSLASSNSQMETENQALGEKYDGLKDKYDQLSADYETLKSETESCDTSSLEQDISFLKQMLVGFAKATVLPDSQLADSYIQEEAYDNVGYLDSKQYDNMHYRSYSKFASDLNKNDIAYVIYRNTLGFREDVNEMGGNATIVRAYYDNNGEFIMCSYVYNDDTGKSHDFAIWANDGIKSVYDEMKTNNEFENYKLPQKAPDVGTESVTDNVPVTSVSTIPETSTPVETLPAVTMGEKNALGKAKEYLDVIAFSYSGLIEQLEYNGFSKEEATYGADNCGADWNEQAAKKAAEYLNVMSFSKSGLIEQLEYNGFTHDQAVYGVEAVGY